MSDTSNGPGWWLASDGKWYPPHLHPGYLLPHPSTDPQVDNTLWPAGGSEATSYGVPSYGADPSGSQSYAGQPPAAQPYAGQPYGAQPSSGQAQPYAGQPYGAQPSSGQAEPYAGQPYGAQPYGAPMQPSNLEPSSSWIGSGVGPDSSLFGSTGTQRSSGWRRWAKRPFVLGAAMVLVVAAAAGVLLSTLGSSTNADGAIINAVNSAIGDKTAHVQMSTSVSGGGLSFSLTGSGSVDFTDNAMQLSMDGNLPGQQLNLQVIYVGGVIYVSVPQIAQLAPGKNWVSLDVSSLSQAGGSGSSGLGSNPLATLHALAQQGNGVSSLGSSTVDGQTVQGYSVTFNQQSLQNEMNGLPDWMKQAVSQVSGVNGAVRIYLAGDGSLVRESVVVSEQVQSTSVSVDTSYDYSDYGAAVSVAAPPADQIMTYGQLQQLAGSSVAI